MGQNRTIQILLFLFLLALSICILTIDCEPVAIKECDNNRFPVDTITKDTIFQVGFGSEAGFAVTAGDRNIGFEYGPLQDCHHIKPTSSPEHHIREWTLEDLYVWEQLIDSLIKIKEQDGKGLL